MVWNKGNNEEVESRKSKSRRVEEKKTAEFAKDI